MFLRQIEYFQAVVENNSFTEAAEQCHISQSAISQQIQSLEAELGVQLLERHRRKFSLTPAGELFYKRSIVLTADLDQLRRDTIRAARHADRELNLGYLASYSGEAFHRAIGNFSELHPEVELRVTVGNHEDLFDGLRDGRLDLVVNDQRRAFSDEYVNIVLSESQCCAELATFNPLSRLDSIELGDLKSFPCILIASQKQQDNEISYYRDVIGFKSSFLFAENLQEARVMVAANKGFMPMELSEEEHYTGPATKRVLLTRDGQPIGRKLCAFRKKANDFPATALFERELMEEFK